MNYLGYWVDERTKKVYVCENFLEDAKNMASNEYKAYRYLKKYFADYEIVRIESIKLND